MKKINKELPIIILFFILMTLYLIANVIPRYFGDLDEVWIYNVAKNVAEGKLLYVDVSTIVTPIFPLVCSTFLKIFGNQIMVMRFLAVFLFLGISILSFGILKKLKVNTYVALFFSISVIYLMKEKIAVDYNFFELFILLAIIYIELRHNSQDVDVENQKVYKKIKLNRYGKDVDINWQRDIHENILDTSIKHDLLVGFLAGICICIKQTTGILISLALIVYKAILAKNKKGFKELGKSIAFRIVGIITPILIVALYFNINGMWKDFFSYCVIGIKEFSNKIPYTRLFEERLIIKILAILMPIILIYMIVCYFLIRRKATKYYCNILTIVPFAVAQAVIIYPISDEIHFLVGIFPTLIGTAYIIYTLMKKLIERANSTVYKILEQFVKIGSVAVMIGISLTFTTPMLGEYLSSVYKSKMDHYSMVPIEEALENRIEEISKFIAEQKKRSREVYILDAEAAIYKIPLNLYDKNYDMFLKGNLGEGGEDGEIKQILRQKNNAIYLIKETDRNWQSPEKVITYIIQNFEKIGEISIYSAYQK